MSNICNRAIHVRTMRRWIRTTIVSPWVAASKKSKKLSISLRDQTKMNRCYPSAQEDSRCIANFSSWQRYDQERGASVSKGPIRHLRRKQSSNARISKIFASQTSAFASFFCLFFSFPFPFLLLGVLEEEVDEEDRLTVAEGRTTSPGWT